MIHHEEQRASNSLKTLFFPIFQFVFRGHTSDTIDQTTQQRSFPKFSEYVDVRSTSVRDSERRQRKFGQRDNTVYAQITLQMLQNIENALQRFLYIQQISLIMVIPFSFARRSTDYGTRSMVDVQLGLKTSQIGSTRKEKKKKDISAEEIS